MAILQLTNQYFIANDTNPTTQVWSTPTGAMVANNAAAVLTWLNAADGRADQAQCGAVIAAVNNGAGLIRVQVDTAANLQTGQVFNFVGNTSGAAGAKAITVIDGTHFDIVGSVWSVNDTGGVVWAPTLINTLAGVFADINNYNSSILRPGYQAVTSAVNVQIPTPVPQVYDLTMTAPGLRVDLPQMDIPGGIPLGGQIVIHNNGGSTFNIRYFDDSTTAFSNLLINEFVIIALQDNSTPNGTIFGRRQPVYPLRGLYGGFGTTFTNLATSGAIPIADGSVWNERVPSGDISLSSAGVVALLNIPNDTAMAGDLLTTAVAAPSTPAAGKGRIYVDSTSKNLAVKDDAGVVKHGAQTKTAAAHKFFTALSDAGVLTDTQPASTDLSDVPIPVSSGGTGDTGTAWSTYTPTISAGIGTPTTVSATGRYKQLGKTIFLAIDVTITDIGTASGDLQATLPTNPSSAQLYAGSARDHAVDGTGGMCVVASSTNHLHSTKADATTWWLNGRAIAIGITYEAA